MIEQQGQVIAVSGHLASVRLGGNSGCPACDAGKGCGAGIFGRLLQRKPTVLDLENVIDARVGQPVVVGLPESVFLRLVFHLYLLPLLAGLAGAVIGHYLSVKNQSGPSVTDGIALLGAIVAAGCGGSTGLMQIDALTLPRLTDHGSRESHSARQFRIRRDKQEINNEVFL